MRALLSILGIFLFLQGCGGAEVGNPLHLAQLGKLSDDPDASSNGNEINPNNTNGDATIAAEKIKEAICQKIDLNRSTPLKSCIEKFDLVDSLSVFLGVDNLLPSLSADVIDDFGQIALLESSHSIISHLSIETACIEAINRLPSDINDQAGLLDTNEFFDSESILNLFTKNLIACANIYHLPASSSDGSN